MKQIFKKIVIFILTLEARVVLAKYKPQIIAVTGSVGKTATKDMLYTIFSGSLFVWRSEKSFNSEIGVPLTILGCQESGWGNVCAWLHIFFEGLALILLKNHYPKVLIVEVGTDRPGDIRRIADWLKPDTVVVTRIPEVPVHVEFFRSRKELVREKTYLVEALKRGGTLVLNADDPEVFALKEKTKGAVITFGVSEGAHLKASEDEIFYSRKSAPLGVRCRFTYKGNNMPLRIDGTIGSYYISVALASLAAGAAHGLNMVSMLSRVREFAVPPGRGKLLRGKNDSYIIDDSYNSSPVAVEAALRSLATVNVSGKKIAVLGDMLELGKQSTEEHKRMGSYAAHSASVLITVGPRAKLMADGAYGEGMLVENTKHFENALDAAAYLKELVGAGDIVLVKGSQSMRMEYLVEAIMAEPKRKKELLVRQEDAWRGR